MDSCHEVLRLGFSIYHAGIRLGYFGVASLSLLPLSMVVHFLEEF